MLTALVLYNCQDLGRKYNGDFEDFYEDYCMLDVCLSDVLRLLNLFSWYLLSYYILKQQRALLHIKQIFS